MQGDKVLSENPLDDLLRESIKQRPPAPKKPAPEGDTLELADDDTGLAVDSSDGGDPYDTSGGFDRKAAWQRVTKR